jgi:hypothetical protein
MPQPIQQWCIAWLGLRWLVEQLDGCLAHWSQWESINVRAGKIVKINVEKEVVVSRWYTVLISSEIKCELRFSHCWKFKSSLKSKAVMLTHCFIAYLKLTNVLNVHYQPQCIIDDNVKWSGILLTGLWVEYNRGNFSFVHWVLQCSWFSDAHSVL